tara:strand:- start:3384 stop:3779 length:396 start_codon:yes stop_codon:yes gene_type:complete
MNIKVLEKNGEWIKVQVQRGEESDDAAIKAIDPAKYEVGQEYKEVQAEYRSTQESGLVTYEEKNPIKYTDNEGNSVQIAEIGTIPDTTYIIGFLEALAVVTFEAAGIEMDVDKISMVAASRAAKHMQKGRS